MPETPNRKPLLSRTAKQWAQALVLPRSATMLPMLPAAPLRTAGWVRRKKNNGRYRMSFGIWL